MVFIRGTGLKMARVLISLKDGFLEQIDKIAEQEQRTRSELVREALRRYVTSYVPSPIDVIRCDGTDNFSDPEIAG
jgi:hypothetical protein